MLLDTHAHLDFPELSGDFSGVLNRARENGIYEIITIGIDIPSSQKAIELAQRHANIFATVGIHPHGAVKLDTNTLETLHNLARERKVVAIGEIGLDYFRNYQPRDIQGECLRQQLRLACEVHLPVVFHIRDAFNDFFEIVHDYVGDLKGLVLHCFSGDWETAKRCLDMGGYLSIPGTVTFPKAEAQQDVVKRAPLDRLLLETDAPYLTPVPYRGKDNEPSYLIYTARKVAELRGVSVDEVARHTTLNAHHVFGLDEIMDSRD